MSESGLNVLQLMKEKTDDHEKRLREHDNIVSTLRANWKVTVVLASIFGLSGAVVTSAVVWLANKAVEASTTLSGVGESIQAQAREAVKVALGEQRVPVGTVVPFAGALAKDTNGHWQGLPDGWLVCDGSAVRSSEYQSLFDAIRTSWGNGTKGNGVKAGETNFNLPDLRGVFLRGVNGDRSDEYADPDSATRKALYSGGNAESKVGSYQDDSLEKHVHKLFISNYIPQSVAGIRAANADPTAAYPSGGSNERFVPKGQDKPEARGESDGTGGSETRPKNAYVLFMIKAK